MACRLRPGEMSVVIDCQPVVVHSRQGQAGAKASGQRFLFYLDDVVAKVVDRGHIARDGGSKVQLRRHDDALRHASTESVQGAKLRRCRDVALQRRTR